MIAGEKICSHRGAHNDKKHSEKYKEPSFKQIIFVSLLLRVYQVIMQQMFIHWNHGSGNTDSLCYCNNVNKMWKTAKLWAKIISKKNKKLLLDFKEK